jgi:uncharacterized integral membrane protein
MLKIIFNTLVVAIIILFALFNQDDVTLSVVNLYEIVLPKFFVVICAFLLGFVTAILVFSVKIVGLKLKLHNLKNKYRSAQTLLNNAGIAPLSAGQKLLKLFRIR